MYNAEIKKGKKYFKLNTKVTTQIVHDQKKLNRGKSVKVLF